MSDDVGDFPEDPIVHTDEPVGDEDDSGAKLDQTFLHLDHDDDDDLCEACRWREMQLMNAAALAGVQRANLNVIIHLFPIQRSATKNSERTRRTCESTVNDKLKMRSVINW